jgi:hypothetical protein
MAGAALLFRQRTLRIPGPEVKHNGCLAGTHIVDFLSGAPIQGFAGVIQQGDYFLEMNPGSCVLARFEHDLSFVVFFLGPGAQGAHDLTQFGGRGGVAGIHSEGLAQKISGPAEVRGVR